MVPGWPLDFWQSQEFVDVKAKLKILSDGGAFWNPGWDNLFAALVACPLDNCKVAFFGEAPYANPKHATGVAFESGVEVAPSLRTLYREYCGDLGIPEPPPYGYLRKWCSRGILLWNVTPTIEVEAFRMGWKAYSHESWWEWRQLSKEIVERLSAKGDIVFVFLGRRAARYAQYVDTCDGYNSTLFFSHPSPMAQRRTHNPIVGSRLFTQITARLVNVHCKPAMDWRL